MSDLEERLDRLEAVVERQQATIETQRDRLSELGASSDEGESSVGVSRRRALQTGGILGLLGFGAGSAGATQNPTGQIGTENRPLTALYTKSLDGPLTGGQTLSDLTGANLTISDGALQVDTTSDSGIQTTASVSIETSDGDSILQQAEILSYAHDVAAPFDNRTLNRSGNPRHAPVEFVRAVDGSTPRLAEAHEQNTSLNATFEWTDDTDTPFFTIELEQAHVTGFSTPQLGVEDIRLTYRAIRLESNGNQARLEVPSS